MSLDERVARLRAQLEHHGHRYYVLDDPEIGDDAYDALLDELRAIEAEHPELVTPDSPTQRVGGTPISKLEKVAHLQPMFSLANVRSDEELRAWIARMRSHLAREGIEDPEFEYVAEPKIDGLAISLVYRDGVLERGATRGNGEIGEDVTHNLRTIPSIPLRIDGAPPLLEVRGEVYMALSDFTALNERRASQGLSTFMNPRNSAAGTIRQLDPALAAERPLSMWCYGIGATDGLRFASHWEGLEWLREHGFRVNGDVKRLDRRGRRRRAVPRVAGAPRRAGLRDRRRRREGRRPRAAAPPRRGRARPALGGRVEVPADDRGDVAAPGAVERRQVRRPAPVRPARAGARRRRHGQARHAAQRGGPGAQGHPLGRRGDRAARRRRDPAGRLAGAARGREPRPRRRPSARPRDCPVCGTPTVKEEGRVFTRCPNRDCPERRWQLLKHFVGAMDVDGLGEKQVKALQDAGLIRTAADYYRLTKEQLLELDGVGEVSAENLLRSIAASRERPFGIGPVRDRDRGRRLRHRAQPRAAVPHDRRPARRDARADRRDARDRAGGGAH